MNERQVLINLVASLCLADHMGDAMEDAVKALKLIGVELPDSVDDNSDIMKFLGREHDATTVWGTSVVD